MKKITIAFLISCGFLSAQVKTVVTPYGEKVDISTGANNGLTVTDGIIQLGGELGKPSVLTTNDVFTLSLMGLQTGLGSDNVLVQDPVTGVIKSVRATAFSPYFWSLKGNSGTNPATDFLGTIDQKDLLFKTNNIERIRINGNNGFTGIGLQTYPEYSAAPKYMLDVVDDVHIASKRVAYSSARLTLENQQLDWGSQGSGIYLLDGQDNGSRREWYFGKTYNPLNNGSGKKNSFALKSMQTDALNYSLADNGVGTYHLYVDGINNRIGIGTITPGTALEVAAAADPLKLTGLQAGAATEKVLTVDNNGIVHKTLSFSKGNVVCNGTSTITVNDPNVTADSIIHLTMKNPTNSGSNYNYAEGGPRVPGTSFVIKLNGNAAAPFSFDYLIIN